MFKPGDRIAYGGAYIGLEERKAIDAVLDRNWWTIDKEHKELERELGNYAGKRASVVNSGSSALLLGIRSLGLLPGDEVITGMVHFPTSITALTFNGLTPVFVDNESMTLGIDPSKIEAAITNKTKAVLVVAIAGAIPDLELIENICMKHGLYLLIDNCDGFGGKMGERTLEEIGYMTFTSFHAAHILCMGEGGAVFAPEAYIKTVSSLREWGRAGDNDETTIYPTIPADYPNRYIFEQQGFNLKPLELQCAMGREQLKKIDAIKELRRERHDYLLEALKELPELQVIQSWGSPSWFGFPMLAKDRAGLRKHLESLNIETRTIFGGNITKQPGFKGVGRIESDSTIADQVMTDGMFLSVHPSLDFISLDYMIDAVRRYYAK